MTDDLDPWACAMVWRGVWRWERSRRWSPVSTVCPWPFSWIFSMSSAVENGADLDGAATFGLAHTALRYRLQPSGPLSLGPVPPGLAFAVCDVLRVLGAPADLAAPWLMHAAKCGDVRAQAEVAAAFLHGLPGFAPDADRAEAWGRVAAAKGDVGAMITVGQIVAARADESVAARQEYAAIARRIHDASDAPDGLAEALAAGLLLFAARDDGDPERHSTVCAGIGPDGPGNLWLH